MNEIARTRQKTLILQRFLVIHYNIQKMFDNVLSVCYTYVVVNPNGRSPMRSTTQFFDSGSSKQHPVAGAAFHDSAGGMRVSNETMHGVLVGN